jgi:hypothetical protein
MPFSLAGLLRLPFGTLLHHSSVFIGLAPRVNVTSLSLTLLIIKRVQMCNRARTQSCRCDHE